MYQYTRTPRTHPSSVSFTDIHAHTQACRHASTHTHTHAHTFMHTRRHAPCGDAYTRDNRRARVNACARDTYCLCACIAERRAHVRARVVCARVRVCACARAGECACAHARQPDACACAPVLFLKRFARLCMRQRGVHVRMILEGVEQGHNKKTRT